MGLFALKVELMPEQPILLVTGASGYLGRHLTARAAESGPVYATYATRPDNISAGAPTPLDITNRQAVLQTITRIAPQAIINCAVAGAGADEQTTMQINAEGARYLAEGAVSVGARLVQVSTDALYDGQQAPYDEQMTPSPISVYGRSKAAAERAVLGVAPTAVVARASLIYGLAEMDRGTQGFIERLEAGDPLILFRDVIRQPVWVETLVTALLKLAFEKTEVAGILHVAGSQAIDRERFGRLMLDWWQVPKRHLAQSGLGASLPHPPPLDLRLVTAKAERLLDMAFPGVDEVLEAATLERGE
jgi:dTDP-4-dehydrorhamnose reductase